MEFHARMAIAHSLHTFWNPVSDDAVDDLIWALDLEPGARVLDIACGAGELLLRIAGRGDISGVGVDISPFALERAREAKAATQPDADITFVESDAKDYVPGATFDVVCHVGASWIWNGYAGSLAALHDLVRPGGRVLFGEPYWRVEEPPEAYLRSESLTRDGFTDLAGLGKAVEEAGFRMLYLLASSEQDWDRYEMLQSLAVDQWVEAHADHPDREEVLAIQKRARDAYLRWGRDVLGFAQMILRRLD